MKKYVFVGLLLLLNFVSYYYEGYFSKASLLFNGFYFVTLLGSAYILCKIELKPLVVFAFVAAILGFCDEFLNTESLNWTYFNNAQPPLFVAVGWVSLMILIFFGAHHLKKYVDVKAHPAIPVLACFGLFLLFSYTEGNITSLTVGLYICMVLLGIYSSLSGTFGWNAAILLTGIIIGSISEFLGASCMLWSFRSGQLLPLPMIFAWSARAFFLSGLLKLLKIPADLFKRS